MTVLLLGGTAEARSLAQRLDELGLAFVSSLAVRVQRPRMPVGETRVGGFGGVDGLTAYLRERHLTAVLDATHLFAAGISGNTALASQEQRGGTGSTTTTPRPRRLGGSGTGSCSRPDGGSSAGSRARSPSPPCSPGWSTR